MDGWIYAIAFVPTMGFLWPAYFLSFIFYLFFYNPIQFLNDCSNPFFVKNGLWGLSSFYIGEMEVYFVSACISVDMVAILFYLPSEV